MPMLHPTGKVLQHLLQEEAYKDVQPKFKGVYIGEEKVRDEVNHRHAEQVSTGKNQEEAQTTLIDSGISKYHDTWYHGT